VPDNNTDYKFRNINIIVVIVVIIVVVIVVVIVLSIMIDVALLYTKKENNIEEILEINYNAVNEPFI